MRGGQRVRWWPGRVGLGVLALLQHFNPGAKITYLIAQPLND
jgi:hypothetical protein